MEISDMLDSNKRNIEDYIRIHFDFISGEHDLDLIIQNAYIVYFKLNDKIKDFNKCFYNEVFLFSLNYIHLLNFENRVAMSKKVVSYMIEKYKVYPRAFHVATVYGIDFGIASDILNYADSNYEKDINKRRYNVYETFEDDVIDQIESKNQKIKRKSR